MSTSVLKGKNNDFVILACAASWAMLTNFIHFCLNLKKTKTGEYIIFGRTLFNIIVLLTSVSH